MTQTAKRVDYSIDDDASYQDASMIQTKVESRTKLSDMKVNLRAFAFERHQREYANFLYPNVINPPSARKFLRIFNAGETPTRHEPLKLCKTNIVPAGMASFVYLSYTGFEIFHKKPLHPLQPYTDNVVSILDKNLDKNVGKNTLQPTEATPYYKYEANETAVSCDVVLMLAHSSYDDLSEATILMLEQIEQSHSGLHLVYLD